MDFDSLAHKSFTTNDCGSELPKNDVDLHNAKLERMLRGRLEF